MKFLEWNNVISRYFFNPDNAGKDVYLYLTKRDIINLARPNFSGKTDEDIWMDFIHRIKFGLPGSVSHPFIVDKAIHSYKEWTRPHLKSIEGVELNFPPYISYLVFFVLPLIDAQDKHRSNNYYDRLEHFLNENGINQNLRNRLSEIEKLWADLSIWANKVNNGQMGYFHLRNFIHANWVYVGKVFYQCVFPPRAIKKLPELFLLSGMIPDFYYPEREIKRNLLQHSSSILHLPNSVIDIIRRSDTNELGQSIIDTVSKEYSKWTGESHTVDETEGITRTSRNDISSRIYLQFQLRINSGDIQFSFRMKSANEFPEDLNFRGTEITEEKGGYSRTLLLPFSGIFSAKRRF